MKKLLFIITILFFLSCGIPSLDYLGGVTILDSSSDYNKTFLVDYDSYPFTTGYVLYSRYYNNDDNKSASFQDLTISNTLDDSEQYVKNLGFTIVDFLESADLENFNDGVDQLITDNDTISIIYDSVESSIPVTLTNTNGDKYYLKSNHASYPHFIGYFSDVNGSSFLSNFTTESTIKIEFVVITTGISTIIEQIESLPVYLGSLQLQAL